VVCLCCVMVPTWTTEFLHPIQCTPGLLSVPVGVDGAPGLRLGLISSLLGILHESASMAMS
jgi:hypothetical protein